ncbi:MAG: formylglycine-generating enzyme family protein [Treponema sp.]|jgi:formylglycine-generating enzyme required for sulfatase activity|nr:formylglycine-generating enzyme family protein [Treponema sp.]
MMKRFFVWFGMWTAALLPVVSVGAQSAAYAAPYAGMALVPAGTFMMGSKSGNEKPLHQVTISAAFSIGKYEVTQKEWRDVMGSNPSYFKGDNLPVEQVSWLDAIAYCNKRSVKEGLIPAYTVSGSAVTWNRGANGYRLPTEAEWEYAARGGGSDTYTYVGSNNAKNVAWYSGNSGKSTHPVGMKQANSLGIHDMSGNVWEWCWDWYDSYKNAAVTDPTGAASGSYRMARGGSWYRKARSVRSANRNSGAPEYRGNDLGFRVARP